MKAIETVYNGYKFRSRLEARWAVFFDALGIEYEYEPEGFELENGMWYLPDFKLKNWVGRCSDMSSKNELYVEVKGMKNEFDYYKIQFFDYPIIILGDIPKDVDEWLEEGFEKNICGLYYNNFSTLDKDYFSFGISNIVNDKYESKNSFELCGADSSYWDESQRIRTNMALSKAKQARFEYGECG